MRARWKRLLVAIDGSSASLRVLEHSLRIVPKSDLELMVLLHVYNIPTAAYFSSQAEFRMKLDVYMQNQIKGWVEPILQHEYKEDISILLQITTTIKLEALATTTSISNSIVDYARHNNADLILIGSTGRSGLSNVLLGSVARNVVNQSHCLVLIVK